jgi:hypothetical protein
MNHPLLVAAAAALAPAVDLSFDENAAFQNCVWFHS